jgi:hypothetical protein
MPAFIGSETRSNRHQALEARVRPEKLNGEIMALESAMETVWNRFSEESNNQPNVNQDFVFTAASCCKILAREIDRLRGELISKGIEVTEFTDPTRD